MFYIVIIELYTYAADLEPFHNEYEVNDKNTFSLYE